VWKFTTVNTPPAQLQYVPDGEPESEVEYLFGELPSIQVVYYNGWDTFGLEFYGEEMFSPDPGKYWDQEGDIGSLVVLA